MAKFQGWPDFRGFQISGISGVATFQGWPNISGVATFQGCMATFQGSRLEGRGYCTVNCVGPVLIMEVAMFQG